MTPLHIVPVEFKEACTFIARHHRHHIPPTGHKFSLAVAVGEQVVGVCIVGRPVARGNQNGWTLEVTRLCTDGTPNACSKLYSAAAKAVYALGYRRLITYILESESGISLTSTNWRFVRRTDGGTWDCESRPRVDKHPLEPKLLFEAPKARLPPTRP